MKVRGNLVAIDGKYFVREDIRGKVTLHPTQWTVEESKRNRAKLEFFREGTKAVEAGEMDIWEFMQKFLEMP